MRHDKQGKNAAKQQGCWTRKGYFLSGQTTIEAAISLPVLFMLVLFLVQPAIILYDRMVMNAAACEACRVLMTYSSVSGLTEEILHEQVVRHLGSVPAHELFHVRTEEGSWDVLFEGSERSSSVRVVIYNKVKLLPLIDAFSRAVRIADSEGYYSFEVEYVLRSQPEWIETNSPSEWVLERM